MHEGNLLNGRSRLKNALSNIKQGSSKKKPAIQLEPTSDFGHSEKAEQLWPEQYKDGHRQCGKWL